MSLLSRRPPRRRIVFMLTPLVDVMFLLLIFFMLSSQTAPYSLLEIMAAGTPGHEQPLPQTPAPAQATPELLVSVARGYARFNGTRVEMADLQSAIEQYKAAGFSRAVVTTGQAATVQDVVSVLEALERNTFAEMRLVTQAAAP
jgi:biopolymer transport protein ExbD